MSDSVEKAQASSPWRTGASKKRYPPEREEPVFRFQVGQRVREKETRRIGKIIGRRLIGYTVRFPFRGTTVILESDLEAL